MRNSTLGDQKVDDGIKPYAGPVQKSSFLGASTFMSWMPMRLTIQ